MIKITEIKTTITSLLKKAENIDVFLQMSAKQIQVLKKTKFISISMFL